MPSTLHDLLALGYFPKELPPVFTTEPFANFAILNHAAVVASIPGRFTSHCAIHNLARSGSFRRRLKLPHPASHYKVCSIVADNWPDIDTKIRSSTFTVSQPVGDPESLRAFRPRISGIDLALERARCRANALFVLRADVSRFYESIYTHSIPWALYGKDVAKADRFSNTAGNLLDAAVRNSQDQQTLGIPIGPDTSFIIGELIASSIDAELAAAGIIGFRFMDDYEMGFTTRSSAEAALSQLEVILSHYELALNPLKTTIEELPLPLDSLWNMELRQFALERLAKSQGILEYFSLAFALAKAYPRDAVLSFAIARLSSLEAPMGPLYGDNWHLFENLLYQCATVEPGSLAFILSLLYMGSLFKRCSPALDLLINATLSMHRTPTSGSELTWALWAAILFKRHIQDQVASGLDGHPDPMVALLALHARSAGIIAAAVNFPRWQANMTADSLTGDQWLLAYEADVKGWLFSPTNHVDGDSFFSLLKQNGVSFYDQAVAHPTRRRSASDGGY